MGRVLGRKLKKHKTDNLPVSIRLPRDVAAGLDKIEVATGLKYDWLLRSLAYQLVKHFDPKKKITLPAVIIILCEEEARQLGFIEKEPGGTDPTKTVWLGHQSGVKPDYLSGPGRP